MKNKYFENITHLIKNNNILNIVIYINLIIYLIGIVINMILHYFSFGNLEYVIGLSSNPLYIIFKPWSIISYSFFHSSFLHLFFNILILNLSGKGFLNYFSEKNFYSLYIMGAVISGLFFILGINILPFSDKNIVLIGSSAAVHTIFWSWIFYSPNDYVNLFFTTKIKVWNLGIVIFALSMVSLNNSQNYGGFISHIGGIITAWIFIYFFKQGKDITVRFSKTLEKIHNIFKPILNIFVHKATEKTYNLSDDIEYNEYSKRKQEEIDRILEKISQKGYESLTKEEKEALYQNIKEDE